MEKCFAYLCVSDPLQVKKDGFTRQEKTIKDYVKAHKLEIVSVFREKGVSGTRADRPTLAQLIISLEKNHHGVKTVIIEKLDRLASDLMVQEAILRDFRNGGFNIISELEGADLCGNDATRKLVP